LTGGRIFHANVRNEKDQALIDGAHSRQSMTSPVIVFTQPQFSHFFLEGIPVDSQIGGRGGLNVIAAFQGNFKQTSFHHVDDIFIDPAFLAACRTKQCRNIFKLFFEDFF
jgi:hypothetical protein